MKSNTAQRGLPWMKRSKHQLVIDVPGALEIADRTEHLLLGIVLELHSKSKSRQAICLCEVPVFLHSLDARTPTMLMLLSSPDPNLSTSAILTAQSLLEIEV